MNALEFTPTRVGQFEHLKSDYRSLQKPRRELLRAAWEDVAPELTRLVCAMGIAAGRADDVVQDVYLTAWRKQPAGLNKIGLRRWLFKVTANRCNLEHRRRTRRRDILSALGRLVGRGNQNTHQHSGDVLDAACRLEHRELVRRALDRLEPQLRLVLVLRYFADFDSKEIGKTLDLPDSTVRSRLRVARGQLASELKRAGYTHD